jgi:hypothetical protein
MGTPHSVGHVICAAVQGGLPQRHAQPAPRPASSMEPRRRQERGGRSARVPLTSSWAAVEPATDSSKQVPPTREFLGFR